MKTATKEPVLLVGDIGGTNARFALAHLGTPGFSQVESFQCSGFATAGLAIQHYLDQVGVAAPSVICIAAAGPVVDGTVRFTNNNWYLDSAELAKDFQGAEVRLLNDFEANAYALPLLKPADCLQIGSPGSRELANRDFTVGVIGPGTGLGAAALRCRNGQLDPIVGEAGHVGFAPETREQMEILEQLRDEFDRVSDERLLSGPGIVNIQRALCKLRGQRVLHTSAAEVFSQAVRDPDSLAAEAVQVFYEVLGQVAGNYALTLGASDGMFICGGIVTRVPDRIGTSRFRTGFERKGRHRSLMEKIPTHLILHSQPGLLGASYCAFQLMRDI